MEGRIAIDVMLDLIPEYEIDVAGLERVKMPNVFGWGARAGPRATRQRRAKSAKKRNGLKWSTMPVLNASE